MREQLISELSELKKAVVEANAAVYAKAFELKEAQKALQDKEDSLLMGKVPGAVIDGKNAEIRAAQLREHTAVERQAVFVAEDVLEGAKTTLRNRQAELQINLALTELIKGAA